MNRRQLVLNSAARAVTKAPKFHHITPVLKSLGYIIRGGISSIDHALLFHLKKSLICSTLLGTMHHLHVTHV